MWTTLGHFPGPLRSHTIACVKHVTHHIYTSPWATSTILLTICTHQTETEPRQLKFQLCMPNPPPCSSLCSPHPPTSKTMYLPFYIFPTPPPQVSCTLE